MHPWCQSSCTVGFISLCFAFVPWFLLEDSVSYLFTVFDLSLCPKRVQRLLSKSTTKRKISRAFWKQALYFPPLLQPFLSHRAGQPSSSSLRVPETFPHPPQVSITPSTPAIIFKTGSFLYIVAVKVKKVDIVVVFYYMCYVVIWS